MGLDDKFTAVRGQVLLMEPLPSISKVFSLILQEKRQRGCVQSTQTSDAIAFFKVLIASDKTIREKENLFVSILGSKLTQLTML